MKGKEIPGLHITRSIGDDYAHMIGVLSEPGMIKLFYNKCNCRCEDNKGRP